MQAVQHASRLAKARQSDSKQEYSKANVKNRQKKQEGTRKQSKYAVLEAALQKQLEKKALKKARRSDKSGSGAIALGGGQSRLFASQSALQALRASSKG